MFIFENANVRLFMQTSPFWSVALLSENDKSLAKEHNISIIFDLKSDDKDDCSSIVKTILQSGISHNLVS